jgi:hypothetical protein
MREDDVRSPARETSPMSSPTSPAPTAAAAHRAAAAPPGRSPARILAVVLGSVIALLGATTAVAGGAVAAIFGGDETITTGAHRLATPTAALVSRTAAVDDTDGVADVLGRTHLHLSAAAQDGKPLFIGVGRTHAVERYLHGVATDEIRDFDTAPFRVKRKRHPGHGATGVPSQQRFWVAQATGESAALDWKVREGDYRFVVMNADGTDGVQTRSDVGVEIPHVVGIGLGVGIGGAVVMLGGLVLLALGLRRRR